MKAGDRVQPVGSHMPATVIGVDHSTGVSDVTSVVWVRCDCGRRFVYSILDVMIRPCGWPVTRTGFVGHGRSATL